MLLPLPPLPPGPLSLPGGLPGLPDLGATFEHVFQQAQQAPAAASELVAPARSLNEALGPAKIEDTEPLTAGPHAGSSPAELFAPVGQFLGGVNDLQMKADTAMEKLASGQDVDIHDVMLATEKASVALQLTTEIRNKLVDAYQEVMRMQV